MHCNFSKKQEDYDSELKIEKVISQLSKFKYSGSIIQNDGKINEDVIQVGWLKWRKALGVICDHKVPTNSKTSFIAQLYVQLYYMAVNVGL